MGDCGNPMQQLVRFLLDREDSQRIEREAQELGLKSSDFLRLLIKLHFSELKLERRELTNRGEEQE